MNMNQADHLEKADRIDKPRRRALIQGGAGLVGATALLSGARLALASKRLVVFDVACKGDTFRVNPPRNIPEGNRPVAGDTFVVEGNMYPEGTIPPGPGFTITDEGRIGRWICRGTFIVDVPAPPPHLVTTQLFLIDEVGILVNDGPEGGLAEVMRVLTGGSGEYRGAKGQVLQALIGTNNTMLTFSGNPAPNFTFTFELVD